MGRTRVGPQGGIVVVLAAIVFEVLGAAHAEANLEGNVCGSGGRLGSPASKSRTAWIESMALYEKTSPAVFEAVELSSEGRSACSGF